MWRCIAKPSNLIRMQDQKKRRLWLLWKRAWNDARTVFKQSRVGLVQSDIDALLEDLELGVDGDALLDNISVLPVDPTRLLCKDNARLVDKLARRQLVQAFRKGGAARYALELSAME